MSKYSVRVKRTEVRERTIHPVWRGIGCVMILIIILLGYALAKEAVDYNQRTNTLDLPDFLYKPVYIKYVTLIPAFKNNDVINKFLAKV